MMIAFRTVLAGLIIWFGNGIQLATAEDQAEEKPADCSVEAIDASFKALKLPPAKIEELQTQLRTNGFPTLDLDKIVGPETDLALSRLCRYFNIKEKQPTQQKLVEGDASTTDNTEEQPEAAGSGLAKQINDSLNKSDRAPKEWNKTLLSAGDCGCSRDFAATVYGFYPYWLATGEKRTLDYSLLDRIGFYALRLNSSGDIEERMQWNNKSGLSTDIAAFIRETHKYRVEVDVSYYLDDWQKWSQRDIGNAVRNIIKNATQKFHTEKTDILHKYLPLLVDYSAVSADGINLYFDYYKNATNSTQLVDIVESLSREIKDREIDLNLNIMLGLNWPTVDNRQFTSLKDILVDDGNSVTNVFIFLRNNTSQSKKDLRQRIEESFSGINRKTVLRKIIPIVAFHEDSLDQQQFQDDLIYLQNNFDGVGLWPLSLASDKDAKTIGDILIKHYQKDDPPGFLNEIINEEAPELCQYVCPNRWQFRIAFDVLAGLLIVYAFLAMFYCRLREFYQRRFLYFVAAGFITAMIFAISMTCDPFLKEYADYVTIIVLLAIIGGFSVRYLRRALQPRLP